MEHTGTHGLIADLPSYQDAITRPDWLELVAPYIPPRDYPRLCLVSQRFYHQFAPHPKWLLRFVNHAVSVRTVTLSSFIHSYDTRRFFVGADDPVSQHAGARGTTPLSVALFTIATKFHRLRCIFLDDHPNLEPEPPVNPLSSDWLPPLEPPLLLSIARCQVDLPSSFFATPYLRSLVYLDVSDMPGSLKSSLAQRTISQANLPSLRILKAQGREMDNATATLLFKAFWEQLWSVDLSRNKLSDDILDVMHQFSFPSQTSRADHFGVEGRLSGHPIGTTSFGKFCAVRESNWSATFSHPHRHVADAPHYNLNVEDGFHPISSPRLNGRVEIRPDSPDGMKTIFSGNAGSHAPSIESVHALDTCRGHQGVTHLYLNGNNISAAGLARMIRLSPGQLQRLECDAMAFRLPEAAPPSWLSRAKLSGTLGWTHVFRPVFSANLQVLRIHHSVVTQLLSLELDGLSSLANQWVAETQLLPRAELAYPEAFVPDMNPRLQSLVLTRIPRYSAGPLVDKLIHFLRLASIQERAIQDIKTADRHGPVTLLGLRHIRLEFEPDLRDELGDDSDPDLDFDAAAVMDDTTNEFSFFGESAWSPSPLPKPPPSSSTAPAVKRQPPVPTLHISPSPGPEPGLNPEPQSARPQPRPQHPPSYPSPQPNNAPSPETPASRETHPAPPDHLDHLESELHTWLWNGSPHSAQVWTGPASSLTPPRDQQQKPQQQQQKQNQEPTPPRTTTAMHEYARLVRAHPSLKIDPVPATPCHIAAGVPASFSHGDGDGDRDGDNGGGSLTVLFSAAWECILCPPALDNSSSSSGASTSLGRGGTSSLSSSFAAKPALPTRAQLRGMRDVVAAIKEYRGRTRRAWEGLRREREAAGEGAGGGRGDGRREVVKLGEPHFHWGGRLEVEVDGAGAWSQSRYWR
ncbi:hypothetical protein CHGG_08236 [Chaetomium globosum CBS 148.51]|uniref:F-box domain-containing protein n=1 Tax=Chaetomium globosum (strain ATCC 6205 / CBS 148.51 / DSM 1962 / NBRC 6347 / NRRL 1970) TaxID=306901 RepID=Q2GUW8_CHAGB|nr:uncharacterized protein CHGG_08236 [Chaetomium globosum CBS 148.51]EAQ86983.1 hypothetical protein CHGG_08236 [Chaetomium globosum CBS 148.51]